MASARQFLPNAKNQALIPLPPRAVWAFVPDYLPELGPIFNTVIGDNWDTHMQTMVKFWSSVMLSSGVYKGTPMPKHVVLKDITEAHFDVWLRLFGATTTELFTPDIAQEFVVRAERIAESFKLGMRYASDPFKVVNAPL